MSEHRPLALVTGASSGIGASFARQLAARGYDLILVARRRQRLQDAAEGLRASGADLEFLVADLAAPAELARVIERVEAGDIDLLVNCAGINGFGSTETVDPELMARVIAVNVTAPTLLVRAALPSMRTRDTGAIINVSSRLAFGSAVAPAGVMPHRGVYAGTKGYLVTFTRTLSSELGDSGIRLQVLCPPLTATEFHLTDGSSQVPEASGIPDIGISADVVVDASLAALEAGELICLPSLGDPRTVTAYTAAEAQMFGSAAGPLASLSGV